MKKRKEANEIYDNHTHNCYKLVVVTNRINYSNKNKNFIKIEKSILFL